MKPGQIVRLVENQSLANDRNIQLCFQELEDELRALGVNNQDLSQVMGIIDEIQEELNSHQSSNQEKQHLQSNQSRNIKASENYMSEIERLMYENSLLNEDLSILIEKEDKLRSNWSFY